jgi:Skp family chaperone for outer membrane proteins
MKKSLLIIALAISIVSCNQKDKPATTAKEMKTAYVDTSKLLEEYTEAKDIESKYKAKSRRWAKNYSQKSIGSKPTPAISKKRTSQRASLGSGKWCQITKKGTGAQLCTRCYAAANPPGKRSRNGFACK